MRFNTLRRGISHIVQFGCLAKEMIPIGKDDHRRLDAWRARFVRSGYPRLGIGLFRGVEYRVGHRRESER